MGINPLVKSKKPVIKKTSFKTEFGKKQFIYIPTLYHEGNLIGHCHRVESALTLAYSSQ